MFSKKNKGIDFEEYTSVAKCLSKMYSNCLYPLEEAYRFNDMISPKLQSSDFHSPPMVLFIGQYSTGKTTMIEYLLGRSYPGSNIGPEPTTDGFTACQYGEVDRLIPGNALVNDKTKQFCSLERFGNNFLKRFACAETANEFCKSVTIVDTPGILAGDKQSVSRGYDFIEVIKWFAARCDLIFLLFDAHKLDISDEFKRTIDVLGNYDTKLRIILNKADSVTPQQLMRVYGALMWSLGKVINSPEVTRVYVGSFCNKPLTNDDYRQLFQKEHDDLLTEIRSLPQNAALRNIDKISRRSREAMLHAYLVSELKADMPMFGKDKKKAEIIRDLASYYKKIAANHSLSLGDFPPVEHMQKVLQNFDFSKFKYLNSKLIEAVQKMLKLDLPKVIAMIPQEHNVTAEELTVKGGVFSHNGFSEVEGAYNPFSTGGEEGFNYGMGSKQWVVNQFREPYDKLFDSIPKENDKITGAEAKSVMIQSKLPNKQLAMIWRLSDRDGDGMLSQTEFVLMCYILRLKKNGFDLPDELPPHLDPKNFLED